MKWHGRRQRAPVPSLGHQRPAHGRPTRLACPRPAQHCDLSASSTSLSRESQLRSLIEGTGAGGQARICGGMVQDLVWRSSKREGHSIGLVFIPGIAPFLVRSAPACMQRARQPGEAHSAAAHLGVVGWSRARALVPSGGARPEERGRGALKPRRRP